MASTSWMAELRVMMPPLMEALTAMETQIVGHRQRSSCMDCTHSCEREATSNARHPALGV